MSFLSHSSPGEGYPHEDFAIPLDPEVLAQTLWTPGVAIFPVEYPNLLPRALHNNEAIIVAGVRWGNATDAPVKIEVYDRDNTAPGARVMHSWTAPPQSEGIERLETQAAPGQLPYVVLSGSLGALGTLRVTQRQKMLNGNMDGAAYRYVATVVTGGYIQEGETLDDGASGTCKAIHMGRGQQTRIQVKSVNGGPDPTFPVGVPTACTGDLGFSGTILLSKDIQQTI